MGRYEGFNMSKQLVWNVYIHNINQDTIEPYNIFQQRSFCKSLYKAKVVVQQTPKVSTGKVNTSMNISTVNGMSDSVRFSI